MECSKSIAICWKPERVDCSGEHLGHVPKCRVYASLRSHGMRPRREKLCYAPARKIGPLATHTECIAYACTLRSSSCHIRPMRRYKLLCYLAEHFLAEHNLCAKGSKRDPASPAKRVPLFSLPEAPIMTPYTSASQRCLRTLKHLPQARSPLPACINSNPNLGTHAVLKPASDSPTVARRPAPPAPTTIAS